MSIVKIQKGDNVKITSGAFKGHTGVVTNVVKKRRKNGSLQKKVSVSDVKQFTDYRKPNKEYNIPGEMKLKDRFIDASNVSLVDEKGKISKVKIDISKEGKKTRILKTTGKAPSKVSSTKTSEDKDSKAVKKNK